MANIVLDASALLAMLQGEPGGSRVDKLLVDTRHAVLISTANWSEVYDRLLRGGVPLAAVERLLDALWVEKVDFDTEQARLAAIFHRSAPTLSLGDRACLALASVRKATAWTTDKIWATAKVGVPVEVLR